MILNTLKQKKYLFISLLSYIFIYLLINPLAQPRYIVGDEWSSFRQIEAFKNGIYRLNGAKDTPFILQGIAAYVFTIIIPNIFLAVRVLNLIVSLFFLVGIYFLLQFSVKDEKKTFWILNLILYNPLVFFFSYTFYSEIFFTALVVWGFVFMQKSWNASKYSHIWMILSYVFCGSSVLVRQQGLLIALLFLSIQFFKKKYRYTFLGFLILSMFVLVYGLWPVYIDWNKEYLFSGFVKLFRKHPESLNSAKYFPYIFTFSYFGLFLFPLIKKSKVTTMFLSISIIIGAICLHWGGFPIGDTLSLGGYLEKNANKSPTSIFNNIFILTFISAVQGFGSLYFLKAFVSYVLKFRDTSQSSKFFFISSVVYFFSNFYISDVYDRYLTVPFVFLCIAFAELFFNKALNIVFFILAFMSILFNFEFIKTNQISYALAFENPTGLSKLSKIEFTESYGKYTKSQESKDFTGLIYARPQDGYKCSVTKTYLYSGSPFIDSFDEFKYKLGHPSLFPEIKIPDNYNTLSLLKLTEPSRNLFGIQSSVGYYCRVD